MDNTQINFNKLLETSGEVGYVEGINNSIVRVTGLPSVTTGEVVVFESGAEGFVYGISEYFLEVVLITNGKVSVSEKVARTKVPISVDLHPELLGLSLDAIGRGPDGRATLKNKSMLAPIFRQAPPMISRLPVTKPLTTKIAIVDTITPLGHGQRELILGDRKTGKTQFLLQVLSSQLLENSVCIYCAIGKRDIEIKEITDSFKSLSYAKDLIVVSSNARESIGKIYITPYTAMTIAEYFRDLGRNVVLIMDDLSTHAQFYRELALLARRFPGRSSYPGDIFYLHAQLMERAGSFKLQNGKEASITCLPVATSILGDFAGYITTNLMSMTDGHIYIDKETFDEGRRPAINPFLSVTRVGHQTQNALVTDVSREVTSFLIEYKKGQNYSHFGNEVSVELKGVLEKGKLVYALFNQGTDVFIPIEITLFLLSHIWAGTLREFSEDRLKVLVVNTLKRYQTDATFKSAVLNLENSVKSFKELVNQAHTIPL